MSPSGLKMVTNVVLTILILGDSYLRFL